jgi:hypothetical protein
MTDEIKRYIIKFDTGARMTLSAYSKNDAITRMKTQFGNQATFIGICNETY